MRFTIRQFVFSILLLAALLSGCGHNRDTNLTPEVETSLYKQGKDLVRQGRNSDALSCFLKLIDERGDDAPESHLEAAILYQQHIKDPIAAIYHYRKYRELRPNSDQADLVAQRIDAATREFARSLPAQPMENQMQRSELLDKIDALQTENRTLKEQLAAARGTVLDSSRSGNLFAGNALSNDTQTAQLKLQPEVKSTPSETTPVPQPSPAVSRKHVVVKGDTLVSISQRYYGTRTRWREIYDANRNVMPNENALSIGMELVIP